MAKEFRVKPAHPPDKKHAEFDQEEIESTRRSQPDVAAIYRIGSRIACGKPQKDSDIDYLVLNDSDEHYRATNVYQRTTNPGNHNAIFIEDINFTRRDLQDPANMKGLTQKLIFLWGLSKPRELVWGEDVLPSWLSPDIAKLFEKHQINDETVQKVEDWAKKKGPRKLSIEPPPLPEKNSEGGKNKNTV